MPFFWAAAGFALLAAVIQLWQFVAARRFPLHRRVPNPDFHPAVSILKPLKGADPHSRAGLASWLAQSSPGRIQFLFGIHDASDPAGDVVRALLAEYPDRDARLVVCPDRPGTNAKVGTLAQLEPLARHDLLLVSDADVHVDPGLLAQLVLPMRDPGVGLANCFYRMANTSTAALRWEAIAVNADFWSQVLQSRMLKPQDFALGAVMLARRADIAAIGGFAGLADHLADDYQLGHRIHRLGRRIELSTVAVDCWDPPLGWGAVWAHQLRWTRTIRVCQPGPFAASVLANGSVWTFAWLAAALATGHAPWPACGLLALRAVLAADLYRTMRRGLPGHAMPWMVWLRDLLGFVLWAAAFLGNTVVWRGTRFRVLRDGRLVAL